MQRLLSNECKAFLHSVRFFFAASFNAEESADLSTLFDVGGIIGKFITMVMLCNVQQISLVTRRHQ